MSHDTIIGGMRHVNFDMVLNFDSPEERWRSEQLLLWKLMILTLRNFWHLQDHPEEPKLYDSGMIYMLPEQLEKAPSWFQIQALKSFLKSKMGMTDDEIQHHLDLAKGVEIFRDIPRMKEHGGGDCDNWAAARAAEICVNGGKARPYLVGRQEGSRTIYHAKVLYEDGSDEDPSIIMGMGGEDRRADRLEECRKNYERYSNLMEEAKALLDAEGLVGAARETRATFIKAKIDALGFLPKDGVFRVGRGGAAIHGAGAQLPGAGVVRALPLVGSFMELRAAT